MYLKYIILMCLNFLLFTILFSCNLVNINTTNNSDTSLVKKDEKIVGINKFYSTPFIYDSTKKYIYLTFDDGPQHGTVSCFELCKKLGVKATFFMVGNHANNANLLQVVKNIKDAYPLVLLANHSSTHANGHYKFFYQHPTMAEQDFYNTQKKLAIPYKIIRLPGNSAWVTKNGIKASNLVKPVCKLLDSSGYNILGWDAEWRFNHKTANPIQNPYKMANEVDSAMAKNKTYTKNNIVILTHDRMFRNPNYLDSLAKFIIQLKQNPTYVFETMDHYPGLKL